ILNETCDILEEAVNRYYDVISKTLTRSGSTSVHRHKYWKKDLMFQAYLDTLDIELMAPCEDLPYLHMDEHYELRINSPDVPNSGLLTSQTIWGILRGLETFAQLLTIDEDGVVLKVNSTSIMDFPRYSHRGLLLDTSRHFYPVPAILLLLDGMEANKLNVFHWHIVDDNSFPYQSEVFPELSEKGAYNPRNQIYTREDMRQVIEYARIRGIRVLVEFDTPGHTESWGLGIPELLTPCYSGTKPDGTYGPIDPINENTYTILEKLFKEVVDLFPEQYIHLGGDEVSFECWESNPDIEVYMNEHNITSDFKKLEQIYIQRIVNTISKLNGSSVVWQEVFDNGVQLPKETVVHIWTGDMETELSSITAEGHNAILSTCWYLDHLKSGGDWTEFYVCNPDDFSGSEEQHRLVLGVVRPACGVSLWTPRTCRPECGPGLVLQQKFSGLTTMT
ncbi:hypothetical protein L9F63_024244, partial [Diploptera punctata]